LEILTQINIMKNYLLSIICMIICLASSAQTPQSFQYQAVVRDASGNVLINQSVSFRLSIISGNLPGTIEYLETHSSLTNNFGVVTLPVGSGTPVLNLFSDINWSITPHFIKVEADPDGNGFIDMGTTQLLSVPYALYSENSGNIPIYSGGTGINIAGTIITNSAPDQTVNITPGGAITVSGTYPNFTISSTDNNTTYSAGTGIDVIGTTITNTAPDQMISFTEGGATTITGTYPNYTISSTDLNTGTPGGLNKTVQFNNSGSFGGDTAMVWDNTNKRLGVGITNPTGRVVIQGSSAASDTLPLFEVKSKTGKTVFVVYPDSVHFYIKDDLVASNRGGFAVSGRSNAKAGTNDYLKVRPDSTRIYTGDSLTGFGVKNIGVTSKTSYMQLTPSNYFIGHQAGKSITTGKFNSFIGYQSGFSNNSGYKNYFIGYRSGYSNDSGYSNIFIGDSAGFLNTHGNKNVFIGNMSGYSNVSGNYNVFLGYNSGFSNLADFNVFIGYQAGYFNGLGTYNVASGYQSLYNNVDGYDNTAYGHQSLYSNTSGAVNCAIGKWALFSNTTGHSNIATGECTLYYNTNGSYNSAYGSYALYRNTYGYYNTACGSRTLLYNTSGEQNTACGSEALFSNTTGLRNTACGAYSLYNGTTGSDNTALGRYAGMGAFGVENTKCTFIGTDSYLTTSRTNVTILGYGITNAQCTGDNQVLLGNTAITEIRAQVTGITAYSDKRFKSNVSENVVGLDFILKLKPVTYNENPEMLHRIWGTPDSLLLKIDHRDIQSKKFIGFLAQDVEKAASESGFDFPGIDVPRNKKEVYSLRYIDFIMPMVKSIQELNEKNTSLEKELGVLKKENNDLNTKIKEIDILKSQNQIMKSDIEKIKMQLNASATN
jgi:trimeric autotransporter adhesin